MMMIVPHYRGEKEKAEAAEGHAQSAREAPPMRGVRYGGQTGVGNPMMVAQETTILLVEDNADDELLTRRALKKSNVCNDVVVARDGAEALDYLFATGEHAGRDPSAMPQVVLLDLGLPKIDGLEVLERIRADERTRLLPVVILTSSEDQEDDVVGGYGLLGSNSFVRKPVDAARFREAVAELGMYWMVLNETPRR